MLVNDIDDKNSLESSDYEAKKEYNEEQELLYSLLL